MRVWNSLEKALKYITVKIFRLKMQEDTWDSVIQFIKFGIVGLSNTVIGYLIYVVSLKGLRAARLFTSVDIYVSQFIMFLLSVAWSFYWNNKLVFKQTEGVKRNIFVALMKTYVTYAFTSLFIAEVLLILFVKVMGINEYVAPIINLIITVPLNFVIQKYWAFRNKKEVNKINL